MYGLRIVLLFQPTPLGRKELIIVYYAWMNWYSLSDQGSVNYAVVSNTIAARYTQKAEIPKLCVLPLL